VRMDKLLYEYQADYFDMEKKFYNKLEYAEELAGTGILSLKAFLDLGFNNSKLLKKDDPDWKFDTGYRTVDRYAKEYGMYSDKLTDEMLDVKVIAADESYEDADGYYCLDIYCVNPKDYELFDKVLKKDKEEYGLY